MCNCQKPCCEMPKPCCKCECKCEMKCEKPECHCCKCHKEYGMEPKQEIR